MEFDEREDALVEMGNLDGYVELNVETWLGPDADHTAKDLVRVMQRHAVEVQLAAESGPTQPALLPVDVAPKRIECPAIFVSGKRDMDHFQAIATHLAATMPNARLLELDWAGHLPSLERPTETTALIIEALTSDD